MFSALAPSPSLSENPPPWETTCTLTLSKVSDMGGEPQLVLALGREEAHRRLYRHRRSWVREDDFRWLASIGVNAVRLPVGWWAVVDRTPDDFVEGAGSFLDKVSHFTVTVHGGP